VFKSWSGSITYASVTEADADKKYLMWTDVSAVKVKDDVYTLIANLR